MSIIIESGEKVTKSTINNSPSKMMYSFPKTMRFQEKQELKVYNFYQIPDLKSTRSTSLGFGSKYDFTSNKLINKAPYYNIPSDFDSKKPHSPAHTFGISREFYEKVYDKNSKIYDKSIPGPGRYNYVKPAGSDTLKFSLFGRREIKDQIIKQNVPGPGE
jgi:hypothetical protein